MTDIFTIPLELRYDIYDHLLGCEHLIVAVDAAALVQLMRISRQLRSEVTHFALHSKSSSLRFRHPRDVATLISYRNLLSDINTVVLHLPSKYHGFNQLRPLLKAITHWPFQGTLLIYVTQKQALQSAALLTKFHEWLRDENRRFNPATIHFKDAGPGVWCNASPDEPPSSSTKRRSLLVRYCARRITYVELSESLNKRIGRGYGMDG